VINRLQKDLCGNLRVCADVAEPVSLDQGKLINSFYRVRDVFPSLTRLDTDPVVPFIDVFG